MRVSARLVCAVLLGLLLTAAPGIMRAAFAVDDRLLELHLELQTLRGIEQQIDLARKKWPEEHARLLQQFNEHGCWNIKGDFLPGGTCSQLSNRMNALTLAQQELRVVWLVLNQRIEQLTEQYRTELGTQLATLLILSPPPRPAATIGAPGTSPPDAQRPPPAGGADRAPPVRSGTRGDRRSPPAAGVRGPVRGHDSKLSAIYGRLGQTIRSQLPTATGGTGIRSR